MSTFLTLEQTIPSQTAPQIFQELLEPFKMEQIFLQFMQETLQIISTQLQEISP